MRDFLFRWKYRWINFMAGAESLNRRVGVENYLAMCAAGKKPLPDAEKCAELATRLGVETRYWPKRFKK